MSFISTCHYEFYHSLTHYHGTKHDKDKEPILRKSSTQKMSCSFSLHVPKALPPLPYYSSSSPSLFISSKLKPFHNNTSTPSNQSLHVFIFFSHIFYLASFILLLLVNLLTIPIADSKMQHPKAKGSCQSKETKFGTAHRSSTLGLGQIQSMLLFQIHSYSVSKIRERFYIVSLNFGSDYLNRLSIQQH